MAFGLLGAIVAISFVLLVIVYATSEKKEMSVAFALGSAIFLFVLGGLLSISGKYFLAATFIAFGAYSLSRYNKVRNEKEDTGDPEEEVSRSLQSGEMSVDEALNILDLHPGATNKQIQDAYRRLMKQFHPDREGNDFMAVKINTARDTLLKGN